MPKKTGNGNGKGRVKSGPPKDKRLNGNKNGGKYKK